MGRLQCFDGRDAPLAQFLADLFARQAKAIVRRQATAAAAACAFAKYARCGYG